MPPSSPPGAPSPGLLLDPRNGPDWDLAPAPVPPALVYVVASQPRSGSTLLCRLLWGTGRAGAPKEYLNPMQLRDWSLRHGSPADRRRNQWLQGAAVGALAGRWGRDGRWSDARLAAHLAAVQARRSSDGRFGLKLHHHHAQRWADRPAVSGLLATARWIRIVREDRVAQAVSWELALQTGRWASWQAETRLPGRLGPVRYRRRRIARRIAQLAAGAAAWDARLAHAPVLRVTYAELTADPVATTRRVLGWLGVAAPETVAVPPPGSRRQGDARNAAWIARYRAGD